MSTEDKGAAVEDKLLRLAVLDGEDLAVVSAHLQDAEVAVADMVYLPAEKRFALIVARFDWPLALKGQFVRARTGVHFERVLKVSRNTVFTEGAPAAHRLLAIAFTSEDAPSGIVLLTFEGGAQVRLTVECLEAEMRDLGPRWNVDIGPDRDIPRLGAVAAGERPGSPA